MEKRIIMNEVETDYVVTDGGEVFNTKTNRQLKGTVTNEGYRNIQLYVFDGEKKKAKCILLHKLVAQYFVENPENAPYVKHKNGNLLDNRAENLCWSFSPYSSENPCGYAFSQKDKEGYYVSRTEILSDNESWKPWPEDNNYYISKTGEVFSLKTNKVLSKTNRAGYERVLIYGRKRTVHRMVYEAFVGPLEEKDVIDHINGIKDDNRIENLRKVSQSDNMKNAQEHGHKGQHKVVQYDKDGNFIKEFSSLTAAAKEMGVTYAAIGGAARRNGTSCGYYWKYI